MTTLAQIAEEKRKASPNPKSKLHPSSLSSKSMESLYSTTSSKFYASANFSVHQRRDPRQPHFIPASNEVRQRVVSARVLRMKNLQNQLTDAQKQIADLLSENRILRTMHKRQDNALSKYENSNAELPQLLNSHAEEIRVWQKRYKQLQQQARELQHKLKQKDAMLLAVSDQNKHLIQLNKDRNLEEREKLTEQNNELKTSLSEKESEYTLLMRRLQLESKSFKTQLVLENNKQKELTTKLEKLAAENLRLTGIIEDVEKQQHKLTSTRSFGSVKSIRTREHKTDMNSSAPSYINTELKLNSTNSSSSTIALPGFPEKPSMDPKYSCERLYKLEKHAFSFRQKQLPPKRMSQKDHKNHLYLKTSHEQLSETSKSNNSQQVTSSDEEIVNPGKVEGSTNLKQKRVNLKMILLNGKPEEMSETGKSSQTSSEPEGFGNDSDNNQYYLGDKPSIEIKSDDVDNKEVASSVTSEADKYDILNYENHTHEEEHSSSAEELETLKERVVTEIEKETNHVENGARRNSLIKTQPVIEFNMKDIKPKQSSSTVKKSSIDAKQKVKLLAALRAIDSNESFES